MDFCFSRSDLQPSDTLKRESRDFMEDGRPREDAVQTVTGNQARRLSHTKLAHNPHFGGRKKLTMYLPVGKWLLP